MEQQAVWLGWNKGCVKDSERDRARDTVREEPAGQAGPDCRQRGLDLSP